MPSPEQNRKTTCDRLGIDPEKFSKVELDIQLAEDDTFIFHQALRSMSFLFTEYVGFVLYHSLGDKVHHYGQKILANHSFASMKANFDPEMIKQNIDNEEFKSDDILAILWLMFTDRIQDLLASDWGENYRRANRRARFILTKESRNRLYKIITDTDKFMQKRSLLNVWTTGIKDKQGFFDFIRECVLK